MAMSASQQKRLKTQETMKPGLGGQTLASRSKYWSEVNTAEKIERLRDLVKSLKSTIDRLNRQLQAVYTHTHNEKGEAVSVKTLKGTEYDGQGEYLLGHPDHQRDDEVYV